MDEDLQARSISIPTPATAFVPIAGSGELSVKDIVHVNRGGETTVTDTRMSNGC